MRRILQGRTTLLITHRLAQIRRADRILVLRSGELVAQGSHDELLGTSADYRSIFGLDAASAHDSLRPAQPPIQRGQAPRPRSSGTFRYI